MKILALTSEHLRTIAALLESGLSTLDTFLYIRDSFFGQKSKLFIPIIDLIHSGADFKTVFKDTNIGKTQLYIHLIESSQTNGAVPDGLRDICMHMDAVKERRRSLIQILVYPCIVSVVLILMIVGILVFVLPQLKPIIATAGGEVPMVTEILVHVSDILIRDTVLSVIVVICSICMFMVTILNPSLRLMFYRVFMSVPILSLPLKQGLYGQMARLIFYYLKSGMNFTSSWNAVFSLPYLTGYMRQVCMDISTDIDHGGRVSQVLQRHPSIPISWILYTHLGETKIGYKSAFAYIAKQHEEAVSRYMAYIQKLIEPVLMIIIGLIVGLFAYAILLPMYGLVQTLQS